MEYSRRKFLLAGGAAVLALNQIQQLVFAEKEDSADTLIFVFLRGGYDALNVLAPVDDANYHAARGRDTRVLDKGPDRGLTLNNG